MGQYHKFMNFDKKEVIEPPSFRKLTEWSYQLNDYLLDVEELLKTRWKNDQVLVIGDYVSDFYENSSHSKMLKSILKSNWLHHSKSIYDYPYKKVFVKKHQNNPSRYIYNHNQKQYVDLKKQPIQYVVYEESENCIYASKFHPLSLLLSCCNGAGGGDYFGKDEQYIGAWCEDSKSLELSDKLLDLNYREFNVKFDERDLKKDNIDIIIDFISEEIPKNKILDLRFSSSLFLNKDEKNEITIKSYLKAQNKENYSQTTIQMIEESLLSLDTEYREALAHCLMDKNYLNESPLTMSLGTSKQQNELDRVYNMSLSDAQVNEILDYISNQMKNDFQYSQYKIIESNYRQKNLNKEYLNVEEEIEK